MLAEARVGVTPLGPALRFAGTLELSGLNTNIDERRIKAIRRAGDDYLLTDVSSATEFVWCGMRPLTPDNLPIIGRVAWLSNLIVAAGHSMTGVTLGASTGKLVAQMVAGEETVVNPEPFSPMRFQ
jgi:D-amino-acid dehydrogenase